MRTYFRALILGIAALVALTAAAQSPYTLIVQGTVAGCTPFQQVTVSTIGNTQPLVSHTLEIFPPNCFYDTVIDVFSPTAAVMVSTLCGGVVLTEFDTVAFNFIGDTAVVTINLNCGGGGTVDCLGIPGGTALPGTPCNDGNPGTTNDTWGANCVCSGVAIPTCQASFTISNSSPWVMDLDNTSTGMLPMLYDWSLPDGSSTGQNSPYFAFTAPGTYGVCLTIYAANSCVSTACDTVYVDSVGNVSTTPIVLDCVGIVNGPNMPGTPCNDNDPLTVNDTWSANCVCQGTLPQNCQAAFIGNQLGPWLFAFNDQSTGVAPLAYQWWLPDGSTTTQVNPLYNFNAAGTYGVCLTITAGNGCTSVTCDTLFVDNNGNISFQPQYYDCMGYPNGTNLPGTPCQIPGTVLFGEWDANCVCDTTTLSVYDCTGILNGPNMPGTACVDTVGGVLVPGTWQANCMCVTNALNDCLGIFNGPNLPGTPCNDGDTLTYNDTWDGTCNCVGYSMQGQVLITGSIIPCPAPGTPVHIVSIATLPPVDTVIATGPNCDYSLLVDVITTTGWFIVETSCDSGLTSVFDSLGYSLSAGIDTLLIDVSCGGLLADCLGIPGGPNMPGTPCNDGDTLTVQDTWTPSCQCVGIPVNYYDCLQIVNGPNLPGTPCNDNNPATIGDTWDANCNCVGSVPQPCNADFWVLQAYTVDSVTNLPVPTPNELWIWNLSSGGTGAYTFLWNFGDGTSSTDPFPTHVYASGGPYILCLTINDSAGCTSTYCDSVSVDANGMYTGIMGAGNDRQNGFTINVRDPLATGITERPTVLGEMALWPNPVQDLLNIALVSDLQGAVSVEVVDMSGRVVRSERHMLGGGRTQFTVPTNDLAPGLHVLRISNGTSSINQRFVRTE
ncbi:MAG: PKD domain-containing protein [Flavobacteriales bacterium]|nr:PKD domain-containing protein [Flavobacteriales bacterium]